MNLIALAIVLGAIPPMGLKAAELMPIAFDFGAPATNIAGDIGQRFCGLDDRVLQMPAPRV
ncbi:hypothetical protein D3C85_1555960 [compost metagenome]